VPRYFKYCRAALFLSLALISSLLGKPACAAPEPGPIDEYRVKGAFIYNLAKFVDWPPDKLGEESPIVIGVAGGEEVERVREVIKNRSIGKHKVEVRQIVEPDELKNCHILFVTRTRKQNSAWAEIGGKHGVLTLGETEKFLDHGGMIRFYLEADSLRMEIDQVSIQQAGLMIKSSAMSTLISKGIARLKTR
jgi:hypothetical protein